MKNLSIVSLKIMAIYFLVTFIRRGLLSGLYMVFTNQMPLLSKIGLILSELMFLIIIYFLWFKAEAIAGIITRHLDIENKVAKEIEYDLLFQTLLALAGVIIITISLPDFIRYIFEILSVAHISMFKEPPRFMSKIAEILLGLFLVYKAQKISHLIFKQERNNNGI